MLNNNFMLINIIDRMKLPFLSKKDRELCSSLYNIIGMYPHDISYYKMALMHKSIMHRNEKGKPVNNERLEFLGDAVLDCAVGDIVYHHFPGKREGFLTNTRSKLVQRSTLNKLANDMGINDLILASGRSPMHNSYLGGNAFEALVGALYLDRGFNACMIFLKKRILTQMINIDKVAYKEVNFKSKLIEWTQKNKVLLDFNFIKYGHDKYGSPKFTYQVSLEGIAGSEGEGFTKKESQQNAAKATLDKLKKEPQFIDEVFAAKGERTKMEEEPVDPLPDTDETQVFMVNDRPIDQPKHETAFRERVFSEDESAADEKHEAVIEQPLTGGKHRKNANSDIDDDISAKAKDREKIIAAAEKAAFDSSNE